MSYLQREIKSWHHFTCKGWTRSQDHSQYLLNTGDYVGLLTATVWGFIFVWPPNILREREKWNFRINSITDEEETRLGGCWSARAGWRRLRFRNKTRQVTRRRVTIGREVWSVDINIGKGCQPIEYYYMAEIFCPAWNSVNYYLYESSYVGLAE